jgi:hypothetical protein
VIVGPISMVQSLRWMARYSIVILIEPARSIMKMLQGENINSLEPWFNKDLNFVGDVKKWIKLTVPLDAYA